MGMRSAAAGSRLVVATAALSLLLAAACGQAGGDSTAPVDGPTAAPAPAPTLAPDDPTEDDMKVPEPLDPPVSRPGTTDLPAAPSGAELVLVVGGQGAEQPPVTLSCDWRTGVVGGDHPQAEQACADLLEAVRSGNPFAPVPPGTMCTQVYGGDAVVEVSGAILAEDGGPVDVQGRFALNDGCEMERWERMGAVLSPYGGSEGVLG
jgi:hypothetical protein